ncbi:group II truncated hemoglobin [Actinoplanes sp. NEAU-A12]|uniref:Group II truncated hemoglobin n=1 Tax=Actinoplanes sandaracinus TaxID=3045177 RepID=A0ABT6WR86_9ACTN|nr:group II truncated hemoglobin [Actinoplanes sandaracinus]MDI6102252.1 group II truncated hemoglobin [Actinoplanes sandaracinus]
MGRPTLYEAAGGAPAMLALATDFHARCLAHPVLEHPFSHGLDPAHVQHLADYWGEVFGGPPEFTRRHGGHAAMLRVHANQSDDGDPFSGPFVTCFDEAVAATLPDDPRLRAALGGYIRAATAEVGSYFPMAARVPEDPPMPLWSWDGRQGRSGSVGAAPDVTRTP